jgi:heme oxygenase
MRDGSRAEHEAAESSPFMAELLDGALVARAYADYLRRYRAVYAALEAAVREHARDPLVAAVADPALERLPAIDADLGHWAPHRSPLEPVDSPAAAAYVERVTGADWGGALVAHHYTRYLGDLSGGRTVGRALHRAFGRGGAGLEFYDFPIAKPKLYKDWYRGRLDALGLSPAEVDRVVEEVKVAFRLNQAVFDELGRDLDSYRR